MPKVFFARCSLVIACMLAWAGCTVHRTETPPLSGPSDFGLSFGITATPDAISQDGGSQSAIVVRAFDATGAPKSGVTFRLDMLVGGAPVDYGTLSLKSVVTGTSGSATSTYTAPAALPAGTNLPTCSGLPGGCLQITATPVGSDFGGARSQQVQLHLVPLGEIVPSGATPTAAFTFNPTTPSANTPVQFDASTSCAGPSDTSGGCPAGQPIAYAWDFSDGSAGSGRLTAHSFARAQTYNVTLTVTNDQGVKASATQPVSIGAGAAPTAAFVFSPTPVVVEAEVYFDASNSRPGIGQAITSYKWNWGDNESSPSSSSPRQEHDYQAPGVYTVVLTVTDQAGQIGTTTQTVTVTAGTPIADFSFLVDNPATHSIQFDGRSSATFGSASITDYAWIFGDGSTGNGPTPTHMYASSEDYTVKLTVTDSTGKTGVVSKTVTVP
jgi:PKD repeat protein